MPQTMLVAHKASRTVYLNARGPKVGLVSTANIGQFQVAVEALSGYMRSGRSGCKLLIPDLQNQDQRPKTTGMPQETRAGEFIDWEKYLTTMPLWSYSQHNETPQSLDPKVTALCIAE